ncbi:unnamed protein product [Amoebophrya sp. A120]|nr:unnamed protein product [Amoebophrya sp. A120]|eukprot:GSA120T00010582001.1
MMQIFLRSGSVSARPGTVYIRSGPFRGLPLVSSTVEKSYGVVLPRSSNKLTAAQLPIPQGAQHGTSRPHSSTTATSSSSSSSTSGRSEFDDDLLNFDRDSQKKQRNRIPSVFRFLGMEDKIGVFVEKSRMLFPGTSVFTSRIFQVLASSRGSAGTSTSSTSSGFTALHQTSGSLDANKIFARRLILYGGAIWVFSLGALFFMVPFFKLMCQSGGDNGAANRNFVGHKTYNHLEKAEDPVCANRLVKVNFNGTVATNLDWEFQPQQHSLYVAVGETALAFFRAKNIGTEPVIGTSTYAIFPPECGLFFNKIQCFCFDEQLVNPGEEVDLPILFYIDPDFAYDNRVAKVEECELSYLFMPSESKVPTDYAELQEMREFQLEKMKAREEEIGRQNKVVPKTLGNLNSLEDIKNHPAIAAAI